MPPSTADWSALALRSLSTKETVIFVAAGAAEIRVPCSEAAVTPCGTATFPELGPVAAPAGATADSMTMDPAVPAASKVPALSRLDQFAGFKVNPPVKVLQGTLPPIPRAGDSFAEFAAAELPGNAPAATPGGVCLHVSYVT